MNSTSHLLRARWIFPVSDPPIENGVIEVDEGRIAGVGHGPYPDAVDLGEVAVIPGLVNAHTHLEFSNLEAPLTPPSPFADWIGAVISRRRQQVGGGMAAARRGLTEICTTGTTLLGEVATSDASLAALQQAGTPAVLFREVLGLDDDALKRNMTALAEHFTKCDGQQIVPGISPHAPYSVPPDLLQWAIDMAVDRDAPVAMHLAETCEELQLLQRGDGPLVELFRSLGIWQDGVIPVGTTIDDYLALLSQAPRVLIIHGNYLRESQMDFLAAQPHMSVIYCPRTHAYFGHDPHPWRELLERGVNIALGTDSRASNPDLNLWNEVLFLREEAPDVPPATLLELATVGGAVALGCEPTAGTLQTDRSADLAVVSLAEEAGSLSAYDRLLHPQTRVLRTMHAGQWCDV